MKSRILIAALLAVFALSGPAYALQTEGAPVDGATGQALADPDAGADALADGQNPGMHRLDLGSGAHLSFGGAVSPR
jgi:hypothetical protein